MPDVPEPVFGPRLLGGHLEAPPGGLEEPVGILVDLPDRYGGGGIGYEAFVAHADVKGDDVSLLEAVEAGDCAIGRAAGGEGVEIAVVAGALQKKKNHVE